ncbi:MAG TPA: hypothetical protein VE596_09200 [Gaiellaceae bacterium]|jgi:hypothetical protein|nr:hypothetical protein [Gaiellaceae bacterium]
MSISETENGVASLEAYVPFTPFQDSYTFEAQPSPLEAPEVLEAGPIVTPFVSEYEGLETAVSPEAQELQSLLFELYDQELDEVLGQIAEEAWNAASEHAATFGETVGSSSAEQFLQEWIDPLRVQAETLIDNVAEALNTADPVSMSEAELDTLFERLEPRGTGLEPYFEDFLGGLTRKLKTFARKAVDVAKKGLTLFPGVGLLLNKLKALLRPLFNKVVRAGIDQLPVALRPVARQLAQRVFGQGETEEEAQGEDLVGAPAAPDVSAIQQQLDLDMAALLFAEDTEQEAIVTEALTEAERSPDGAPVAELQEARARFVDELERGVDPQQALENFVPAVMAVLPIARTVIGTIGRGRVVNFLAGFLAKFISRYVPAEASNQLSQAIVDTGLRMVSLEAPSPAEVQQLAPDAVASAVEDTVRRVAELDETTLEHPALLEAAVTEAFHQAAAENFPPQVLIPELHEATVHGTWVAMPLGRRRKYYKKYTRVFDVQITPQIAASLKTSSGSTIAAFLKDQLGVTAPVHARVHVYQAMTGTTFARIARLETGVSGLGRATRRASALFHPLTVRAAGALLHEPKLGRDAAVFAHASHRIAVGQRFYYLEIAGARPVPAVDGRRRGVGIRRSSEVNITLDFPKDEFRVFAYLSEADAQDIAGKLRKRDVTAVLVAAKRIYQAGVETALGGDIHRHVKILTEALPQEQLLGSALRRLTDYVKKRLMRKVVEWVGKGIADYVQARSAEFVSATEDPADGVTLIVRIVNPPGAPLVRKLLRGDLGVRDVLGKLDSYFKGDPKIAVQTVAGFRFD